MSESTLSGTTFFYWNPPNALTTGTMFNPWESYRSYVKDMTLATYTSNVIGQYVENASKEQIQAISTLGKNITGGMSVLSRQMAGISQGIQLVSEQIYAMGQVILEELSFINKNLDIQIEQQRLSNLLLQNIAELLRVPDSEKERQHCIELGVKFFVNAQKDPDLFSDALEELLKAESLMKQDYFVLHRIGCIYLYVESHINPEKALDYFLRAAKYASVESDIKAIRSFNALMMRSDKEKTNELLSELKAYEDNYDFDEHPAWDNSEYGGWYIEEFSYMLYTVMDDVDDGYKCEESKKIYFDELINDKETDNYLRESLVEIQNKINSIIEKYGFITDNLNSINAIAADSYEKAAFASYVLGQFDNAAKYQSKAYKLNGRPENQFVLSKYQVRSGRVPEAVDNLSRVIDVLPKFAIGVFRDLDLMNESQIVELINHKNEALNRDIDELIEKWKSSSSTESEREVFELMGLKQNRYDIKQSGYYKSLFEYNNYKNQQEIENQERCKFLKEINELQGEIESLLVYQCDLDAIRQELSSAKELPNERMLSLLENSRLKVSQVISLWRLIDDFILSTQSILFLTLNPNQINAIVEELKLVKGKSIEKIKETLSKYEKIVEDDKLKIGSHYAGGIVFYLDESGKHGLVCSEKEGRAKWGQYGEIGASETKIGGGIQNTIKIVEFASWEYAKWWSSKKTPCFTAARICFDYNNGYAGWYLPTIYELKLMNNHLHKNGIGNFSRGYYWSSTEVKDNGKSAYLYAFTEDGGGHEEYYDESKYSTSDLPDYEGKYFYYGTYRECPDFTKIGVHYFRPIREF